MLGDVEVVEVEVVEAEAAAFDVDEEAGTAAVVTETLGIEPVESFALVVEAAETAVEEGVEHCVTDTVVDFDVAGAALVAVLEDLLEFDLEVAGAAIPDSGVEVALNLA